jgi:hypothetical protein
MNNPRNNSKREQFISVESLKPSKNINNLEFYSDAKDRVIQLSSESNSPLDQMMAKVHRERKLGQVEVIMDKVDNTIRRYRNDKWRRYILPAPLFFIWAIEDRFKSKESFYEKFIKRSKKSNTYKPPDVSELLEALDYESLDIVFYLALYLLRVGLFLIIIPCVIGAIIFQIPILFSIIPIFVVVLVWDLWFAGIIINQTGFVPLYDRIKFAILRRNAAQEELIENSVALPTLIENRMLEYQKNIAFSQLEGDERNYIKRLELEGLKSLQGISAAVAKSQATTDAQVRRIQDIPELRKMEDEIRIKSPEREHQVVLAEIQAMEKILKEKMKAIANNDLADRDLERDIRGWQSKCASWRGKLRDGSISDVAKDVEDFAKDMNKKYQSTQPPKQ